MITGVYGWITVGGIFLILEMGHPGLFFFLSFFIGSLASAGASYGDYPFTGQLLVFLIVTSGALCLTRILAPLFQSQHHKTNVDALIGKQCQVIEDIVPPLGGYVKIAGTPWRAYSVDKPLMAGQMAIITQVKGAHVIVKENLITRSLS